MSISTTSRLAKAGALAAAAKIEDIHLLYLAENSIEYLNSFLPPLIADFERRKKEWPEIHERQLRMARERRAAAKLKSRRKRQTTRKAQNGHVKNVWPFDL